MRDDIFSRNADATLRGARATERSGLQDLERGILDPAIAALREAGELYESLGDAVRRDSAQQYMALAMYEIGEVDEAVRIWEDLVSRGWVRPTTLSFLVRHYESLGDDAAVERAYAHLHELKQREEGFLRPVGRRQEPLAAPADAPAILVADNDPAVRTVLGRTLEREGYRVRPAEDGEEAFTALFEGAPDLAFLDVYMPRYSGLDVLYRMRAGAISIPVVVLSGRPGAPMVRDAAVLGAHIAGKPLNFKEILRMVGEMLAGRHSAAS
jgi:two-component system chemotaxis response regulator CheY